MTRILAALLALLSFTIPVLAQTETAVTVFESVTTVTHAQILALHTTPVQIAPAPEANEWLLVQDVALHWRFDMGYLDRDDVWFTYTTQFNDGGAGLFLPAGLWGNFSAATKYEAKYPSDTFTWDLNQGFIVGQPLYLWTASAFSGGDPDNTVKVIVHYRKVHL